MRIKYLPNLFNFQRLTRLRRDFKQPFAALLACSGIFSSTYKLAAKDGSTLTVNGHDRPLWEAYFRSEKCDVSIEDGMFRVTPHDQHLPAYSILPGHNGLTFMPSRWNHDAENIPLIKHLQQSEKSIFSQHGEDGIIESLLNNIPTKHNYIIEFGAHDGINMSNSRYLIDKKGWSAFLIEGDKRFYAALNNLYRGHARVKTQQTFITPENIDELFTQAGTPEDFELMSIDIDSIDYHVWEGLKKFTPKIVIVEYNSTVPADVEYIVDRNDAIKLSGTSEEGASLLAYERLAIRKGYQLIYTELSGSNAFFIHESCKQYFADVDWSQLNTANLYQSPQFGVLAGGKAINGRGYAEPL